MQFNQMQFRAVAFVLAKAIFGKARAEVAHNRVARHLGNHARCGDAEAEAILRETRAEVAHNRVASDLGDDARGGDREAIAIAVDDGRLGQGEGKNGEAVDENVLRLKGEPGNGRAHRLVGGAQNVDGVDLDRVDNPNGPCNGIVRHKIVVDLLAFLRQKLL